MSRIAPVDSVACAMLKVNRTVFVSGNAMAVQPDQKSDTSLKNLFARQIGIPTAWLLAGVAIVTFAADQLSKYLIRKTLDIGESWPQEGFFRITHGTNTGTAFGLFPDQTLLLTIASVVAIGFIIYFYRAHSGQTWFSGLTVGLLLGGAFGNLVDRVVAGKVTDFIGVGPWPIFNVADSAVVVGIALLVASMILFDNAEPEVAESEDEETDERELT